MKKLTKVILWGLVLALLLTACGGAVENTPPVENTHTDIVADNTQNQQEKPDSEESQLPDDTQQDEPEQDTQQENQSQQDSDQQEQETQNPGGTQNPDPTPELQRGFAVHFIDVGQADAALVLCDGKAMLIDGGNVGDSSRMYTYLKKNDVTHLDYVIGTHAHEDHIGGIAGALNYATVGVAYSPVTSYSSNAFENFKKAVEKHGVSLTVPSVGTTFSLGSATCTVLAVNTLSDTNNTSIVLRVTYGATTFLFTGDAEREVEEALVNRGANLSATVLKVGHHGSSSSTGYLWLREVMPSYAVISVGTGNTYGHPTEQVLSRLRDAEVKTFRTDMQGDIICWSDGSSVTFSVSRNANADVFGGIGGNSTQQPETPAGTHYVLNNNSMKFHYEDCSAAQKISSRNREDYYGTREELIEMGYASCGMCTP
jgi:competence protein ComEC